MRWTAMSAVYATHSDRFFIGEGLKDMATEKVDDGPAFPSNYVSVENGSQWTAQGMTLRDYFAAKAMHAELVTAGALEGPRDAFIASMNDYGHTAEEHIAFNAYSLADAMLKERAK